MFHSKQRKPAAVTTIVVAAPMAPVAPVGPAGPGTDTGTGTDTFGAGIDHRLAAGEGVATLRCYKAVSSWVTAVARAAAVLGDIRLQF